MMDLSTLPQDFAPRRRLLLVEDDPSVQASLRMFLEPAYEVHSASTVAGGVDLFKRLKPSLVLLDLRLPDGNGLDALRQIRSESVSAPVIVLTGYASMNSVEESLRLGASDFLHKPFDGFALKARIDSLVTPPPAANRPLPTSRILQSLAKNVRELADLETEANAAATFLHDAESPLTAALNAAHLLNATLEEHPERYDNEVKELAMLLQRTMGFVSGLLEQSRYLNCWVQMEPADLPVGKVIDLAMELAQSHARQRKVAVSAQLLMPDARVHANHFALARVLLNLLRNAIEAVEPETGKVVLSVDVGETQIEFLVQDNGPGLDPPTMVHIFDAHFTTRAEGSGLGLYICKHLVEKMGGTLTVHNTPGRGCLFSVEIARSL